MVYDEKKVIIFDLWGTLLENGIFPSPSRQTKKIMGLFDLKFHEYIEIFEKAFMTKNFNNLKEAFDHVFKEMDVDPKDYNREERLIGLWNKNKLFVKPYQDTTEVLEELQTKYDLVLLSNSPFYTDEILAKFDLEKYFKKIYLSYETGYLKSETQSFEMVLNDLDVKAEDCLMVGDSIESDMHGARAVDIDGVLIDRRNKREFESKVLSLTELKDNLIEK
ncbi:hypothetical protein BVX95_00595 [archaeon D22]|nr:hypothetical protein BVX95_00595 [archaeon D22]